MYSGRAVNLPTLWPPLSPLRSRRRAAIAVINSSSPPCGKPPPHESFDSGSGWRRIGPEVTAEGTRVLRAVGAKFGHTFR